MNSRIYSSHWIKTREEITITNTHSEEMARIMTLDKVKINQVVKIEHIDGGRGIRQRLNQMGLFEGSFVKIRRESALGGPLVLEHNNSEIAIGRGMARRIMVSQNEKNN